MKKKSVLIAILASVVLVGVLCACSKESKLWDSVVNNEFSNFDNPGGNGIYFYEEDHKNYCTFMIYGNAVNAATYYTSEIEVVDNKLIAHVPIIFAPGYQKEESDNDENLVQVEMHIIDGRVLINNIEYEIKEGVENHKCFNVLTQ